MDKFDLQIATLKPTNKPVRLDEKQFTKKLRAAQRARRGRHILMALMALAAVAVLAGALRRNIFEVLYLTIRYVNDLPSMLTEFARAYTATISWPSVAAIVLLVLVSVMLFRARKDLIATRSRRTYRYATIMSVLAIGLGIIGIFGSSAHASAQQEALKRTLNARGHLEVRVGNDSYELYSQSQASDDSIRKQALIERIRDFDISKAYPELKNFNRDGFVAEIRAVNPGDGCVYYVERRLEPALNEVMDANSGCIRSDQPVYYLNAQLKPVKKPSNWKIGQAAYFSYAQRKDADRPHTGSVGVVVLLGGKADDYIARSNSEKIVPKGQPGTGVQSCGIDGKETCPKTGLIDVFTNAEDELASGEIGSSVPGDSLRPRPGSSIVNIFGKITGMDDRRLRLETPSGKQVAIAWPHNYIQEFNAKGATHYPTPTGPLNIQTGDHLDLLMYYKDSMDLQQLAISDVLRINLAIKIKLPDPLQNESYTKDKNVIEKY